ncbi:hypothetical protein D3C86_1373770 [compost metagenome]
MGLANVLCYKLEDIGRNELFLVSAIDASRLACLKEGRLSVRGALESANYWIVETRAHQSTRAWTAASHDLPDDFLPAPKSGLFSHFGDVPDHVQQIGAFLSVKFSGPELSEEAISLKKFKELVDTFYESVTKLFTPSALDGVRKGTLFDYELAQPKLASLLLSIKRPVVDIEGLQRRRKTVDNNLLADINGEINADRDQFLLTAQGLVDRANGNAGLVDYVAEHYEYASAIANLSPYSGGGFDRVEFDAETARGLERIVITEQTGIRIREARDAAASAPRQVTGTIIEVNAARRTFVLRSRAERQVTCALLWEMFDRHQEAGSIRIGARVTVYGSYWERVRRDYIEVQREPAFH